MDPVVIPPSGQTPVKLARVIRFHLGELSARNGHHEFENLCRHLARARIYRNILPATGPVSAGGDQGRDFETYSAGIGIGLFDRRISDGKAVFLCSIEKRIEAKIKADVNSALKEGRADEIFYFCESNLPVGRRHALQDWVRKTHDVPLEIFDGSAIAEMLSDRDVFWIAQEFLHIPAEIVPATVDQDEWYGKLRERWSGRAPLSASAADFAEIKFGLRRATRNEGAKPDFLRWIGLMERFTEPASPRHLQRWAAYEIAVAFLRGKSEMTSQLPRLRDFFSDLEDWLAVADMKDASVLLVYAFGGLALKQLEADPAELFAWRGRLQSLLDREILGALGPGRRSTLLDARAFLQLVPEVEGGPLLTDRAFDDWELMLKEAEATPLFPIAEFAAHLSKMTGPLGPHPRFAKLAEDADALLAKRQGPMMAAESTFERARAFYKIDDLLQAVRDLHRVQQRWLTGDSMVAFQQASYLLATSYLELGAAYAAKYVALAAAFVARTSDDQEVARTAPTMLFRAADADDTAGNSMSFLRLLLLAMLAHVEHDADPLDHDRHPDIRAQLGQAAALRGLAARAGSYYLAQVDAALSKWPPPLQETIIQSSLDPDGFWTKGSWDETWSRIEESFVDRPFGDLGATRTVSWRALGVRWTASFANVPETVAIAEETIATLQIVLVALAGLDLCLLPLNVHLNITLCRKAPRVQVREEPSVKDAIVVDMEVRRQFSEKHVNRWIADVFVPTMGLLSLISLLPRDILQSAIERELREAAGRVYIARPYRELYREFTDDENFERTNPTDTAPLALDRRFDGQEHPLLASKTGPGPTYSKAEALERIGRRYEKGIASVGYTTRRLGNRADRRKLLVQWHREGLRDWEILSIIANAAANLRHPLKDDASETQATEALRAAFDFVEDPHSALDPDLIPVDLLQRFRQVYQTTYLRSWDLDVHFPAADEKTLEAFLVARYGLRSDDVEHPDVFAWETTERGKG
ncbi:hypothetical protein [Bradyrhizobium sp. HKCCYLR20261]|uniref:hypothetical protein n=1 Tax=Bradyrhizobium sp. HKCCYLR20261 TaxID=3420760 RepID=UPI003EBBC616